MRQKARLAAWLLALDLAALCQGNADRQACLSQPIKASLCSPGPEGQLCTQTGATDRGHRPFEAGQGVTLFVRLKDSKRCAVDCR
ncbi:BRD4-interacting chromatin-remodeling complex-associated protein-like [Dissostichus eleginoides]|uniref:BRD4-interacting chromatin-remodeling complex-associated protein-like n=1 Tax=Dissostichus eleginoides TaxID=100907 RepID=A0AAD9CPI0_DISEL|nr:BRD4-interacting chromatin-remodeling complex-associated protein-like [Dissostichus eleginoides]